MSLLTEPSLRLWDKPMNKDVTNQAINWPVITDVLLLGEEGVRGTESAFLLYSDGRREQGYVSRFDPDGENLAFDDGKSGVREIHFTELSEIRLTRPLRLGNTPLQPRDGIKVPSSVQPYRIELAKGGPLMGDAVGWKKTTAGIFLLVVAYGEAAIRIFVPRTAIRASKIGQRLGEALVADKALSEANLRLALAEQSRQHAQRLGEMLAERSVITREQLHTALKRQAIMPMVKIGDTLLEMKLISPSQLEEGLAMQKKQRDKPLGQILVELGLVSSVDLTRALSQRLGVPFVDLNFFKVDPDAVHVIPADVAREIQAIPICREGAALVVAMEQPLDSKSLQQLRFAAQMPILPVLADAGAIRRDIAIYYGEQKSVGELRDRLSSELVVESQDETTIRETDNTLVQLINKIITDAFAALASDIHIECNPGNEMVVIRFRHDGVLTEYLRLPATFRAAIVSRIKIMAEIDISERRRGQDGRIDLSQFGGPKIELRVAVLPTGNGLQDVVMRILGTASLLPFNELGFRDSVAAGLKKLVHQPHGLILVCGPTGSGKTMTLHSLLAQLNTPGRKIWTAEDPVEITQPGLRQVQVNSRIGWTFAAAIRMFLRADPDVIMVGEMRDVETSKIAIEAALTGHLVFSTLHTNSAAESVVRLVEHGIDPYSFADSLLGVLAQRLFRRLCMDCRRPRQLSGDEEQVYVREFCAETSLDAYAVLADWHTRFGQPLVVHDAVGCERCAGKGYAGRMGIHELLMMDGALRRMVQDRTGSAQIHDYAVSHGMRTLKQDGIEKVLAGYTELSEVHGATL